MNQPVLPLSICNFRRSRFSYNVALHATSNNKESIVNKYDDSILSSVTDDEIILACIAHLQRHHLLKDYEHLDVVRGQITNDDGTTSSKPSTYTVKMGWSKKNERLMRKKYAGNGYFWDKPHDLKYLRRNSIQMSAEEEHNFLKEIEQQIKDESDRARVGIKDDDSDQNDVKSGSVLSFGYGFSSFPTEPDEERVNRMRAARLRWQDQEFRKQWYASRWGENYESVGKKSVIRKRVNEIIPEILDTAEFKELQYSDIVSAVNTYVKANKKRSLSHALKKERNKQTSTREKSSPSTLSFEPPETFMKELQEKRSSKAKRAYETRKKNANSNKVDNSDQEISQTNEIEIIMQEEDAWKSSSNHAAYRVLNALNANRDPYVEDIQTMMMAKRLAHRRKIYRRIIRERFGLEGKCVEAYNDSDSLDYFYPTHCNITILGEFICKKLSERRSSQKSSRKDAFKRWLGTNSYYRNDND